MKAPEYLETKRLILRRPLPSDAEALFHRYTSDPEVTRYLSWPRLQFIEQTRIFIKFSDYSWEYWPAGPYVIESRNTGLIMGGTGFDFENKFDSSVGYVLARDSWNQGYATEALMAIADIALQIGLRRLFAYCHPEHQASFRVLEKCGFMLKTTFKNRFIFPNLSGNSASEVQCYLRIFS